MLNAVYYTDDQILSTLSFCLLLVPFSILDRTIAVIFNYKDFRFLGIRGVMQSNGKGF